MEQLEKEFSLDRVSKSPAVFDLEKLRWINSQYLRALSKEDIAKGIIPFISKQWQDQS